MSQPALAGRITPTETPDRRRTAPIRDSATDPLLTARWAPARGRAERFRGASAGGALPGPTHRRGGRPGAAAAQGRALADLLACLALMEVGQGEEDTP